MLVSRATPLGTWRLLAWAPLARSPTREYREAVRPSQPRDSEREGRIGWHGLRHTCGSHLAMRGVPLKLIQDLMGHATIDMTMRHAHLSPDMHRAAAEGARPAPCARAQHTCNTDGGGRQPSVIRA